MTLSLWFVLIKSNYKILLTKIDIFADRYHVLDSIKVCRYNLFIKEISKHEIRA